MQEIDEYAVKHLHKHMLAAGQIDERAVRIIEAKNDQLTAYEQLISAALVIARDGSQSNVPGRMRLALDQVVELLSGGEVSK